MTPAPPHNPPPKTDEGMQRLIDLGQIIALFVGGVLLTWGAWEWNPAAGKIVLGLLLLAEALSIKPAKLLARARLWKPPYRTRAVGPMGVRT